MSNVKLGDYFCQRGNGVFGAVIRFVTRSPVNHAGVEATNDGQVVEALSQGAVLNPNPDPNGVTWSTDLVPLTDQQRADVAKYALELVGTPYGWLDVIALGALQYGVRLPYLIRRLQDRKLLFCSQLVDEAYLRAGVHLFNDGRIPQNVTPGALYNLLPSHKRETGATS